MAAWIKRSQMSKQEIARVMEDFLEGRDKSLSWDSYTLGRSFEDKNLEEMRLRCANLTFEFPPSNKNEYCNEEGRAVIRNYIKQLRDASP